MSKLFVCVALFGVLSEISGHGMMLDPSNRASRWRFNSSAPINYLDNQYFCGGFIRQYGPNEGKCGACGDDYRDPVPRSNENTGTFGNGVIVRSFEEGIAINVGVLLTANHKGWFLYSLCELNEDGPEDESCFQPLRLADGSANYTVFADDYLVINQVQLPAGVKCEHCVLRWHYNTGNSWGECANGTGAIGCGDQETFRSCADIAIY